MENLKSKISSNLYRLGVFLVLGFGLFLSNANSASAYAGELIVNVYGGSGTSSPVQGVYVEYECSGNDEGLGYTSASGTVSGNALGDGGADCDASETIWVTISKYGYQDETQSATFSTTTQNTFNFTNFAENSLLHVYVKDELNNGLAGLNLDTGENGTCLDQGEGNYRCNSAGSFTVSASKAGYVTDSYSEYIDGDGVENVTLTLDFQLKISTRNELGTVMNPDVVAVNGYGANAEDDGESGYYYYYFAPSSTSVSLNMTSTGFVPASNTNSGLASFNLSSSGQTVLNFGNYSAAASITSGAVNNIKGLEYIFKSGVLKTELGGNVTDVSTEDLTITGAGGTSIISNVAVSNTIYIAATGNGGGNDYVYIRLDNVTADGGSANGADFVETFVLDTENYILAGTQQRVFDIGPGGSGYISSTGFKYPLKVNLADELGNSVASSSLYQAKYNDVNSYVGSGNSVYFANANSASTLELNRHGFSGIHKTNSGFLVGGGGVATNQANQTVISLGEYAADTDGVVAGSSVNAKGLEYALKSNVLRTEIGTVDVSSIADSEGFVSGGNLSSDVILTTSSGAGLVGGAVDSGVIYIAANNGGDINVKLQNVDADGGEDGDGAFVQATLSTGPLGPSYNQKIFSVGGSYSDTVTTTGFKYPLKVSLADQFGSSTVYNTLDDAKYNSANPYFVTTTYLYFANTSTAGALDLTIDGYVNSTGTNNGLASLPTNQTTQTSIVLGDYEPLNSAPSAGSTSNARGFEFSHILNVINELDATTTPDTVYVGGLACTVEDNFAYCAVPVDDDDDAHFSIALDGYVSNNSTTLTNRTGNYSPQVMQTSSELLFSHILTIHREGDGDPVNSATVSVGAHECVGTGEGGNYYCAIPVGDDNDVDASVVAEGYETNTGNYTISNRASGSDAQEHDSFSGLLFQLKVSTRDELGNDMDINGEGDDDISVLLGGVSPSYTTGNVAYFAVNTSSANLSITLDGFVDNLTTNSGLTSVSTGPDNGQTEVVLGRYNATSSAVANGDDVSVKGLEYALRVSTLQNWKTSGVFQPIVSSTVTAGDSFGVTCTEDDYGEGENAGYHYCAVPLTQSGVTAKVVRSGYLTGFANYEDRDDSTDAQSDITVYLGIPGSSVAPDISSVSPANASSSVSVYKQPYVVFNKAMDVSTLNSSNIKLCSDVDCGGLVSATVQVSEGNTRATIVPDATLSYGTTYYIRVTDGVQDTANVPLSVDGYDQFSFITASSVLPVISSSSPSNESINVAITKRPYVVFSKVMDVSTLNSSNIKLCANSGCTSIVTSTVQISEGNTRATIVPDETLDYSTIYYIRVTADVKDAFGFNLATTSQTFFTTTSTPSGTVSAIYPNEENNIPVTIRPYVVFTDSMDVTTLNSSNIQLCTDDDCGEGDVVSATVQASEGNTRATIVPDENLEYGTIYYVRVNEGVKNANGSFVNFEGDYYLGGFETVPEVTTTLAVTGIDAVRTFATADNSFDNGFSWTFHITLPTSESSSSLKFSDFVSGSNTILAAGNIRYYSAQSSNRYSTSTAAVITANNEYSSDNMIFNSDLDSSTAGRQVNVTVQMRVPTSTAGGSYSGSYGVASSEEVEMP